MTPIEAKAKVLVWLRGHALLFAALEDDDGAGARLLDRMSGKQLPVRWGELREVVEKSSALRPQPYLLVVWHDGRQVALADVGFAFAPSTRSTGPLPELPDVFCFRDLRHLMGGAQGLLEEEGRGPDALRAILLGIALLDGARDLQLDVSREERQLEKILAELEQRGVKP